jgi:hypothetical protein
MDLSKLNDSDLAAVASGDMSKVSDEGLSHISGQTATVATKPALFNANAVEGGVPKWGRDNPNLYAGAMTALDLAPIVANLAKTTGVGIPLAGAINAGAKSIQRNIGEVPTTPEDIAADFVKGMAFEGIGRGANAVIQKATNIPAVSGVLEKFSNKLTDMALKQPTKLKSSVREMNLETAHAGGFRPTPSGVDKLTAAIADTETKLADGLAAGQAKNVRGAFDKAIMNIEDLKGRALRSDDPSGNLKMIDDEIEKLVNHPLADTSGTVGIGTLQSMKVEQGRALNKTYGQEQNQFKNLIDKARIRGFKEELESKLATDFPELAATNKQLSQYYDLNKVLENASNRISNNQGVGIGLPIKSGAGAGLGAMFGPTGAAVGGAIGTGIGVLEHPLVSPVVGQAVYNAAKLAMKTPGRAGIKKTGEAIGPVLRSFLEAQMLTSQ